MLKVVQFVGRVIAAAIGVASMGAAGCGKVEARPSDARATSSSGRTDFYTTEAKAKSAKGSSGSDSVGGTTGSDEGRASWDRLAAIDGASCRERLKELKVVFRSMPDRTEPSAEGCGIPHGVVVSAGPTGIRYAPPLQVDCSMALELPEIERKLQTLAEEHLESPLRRVGVFGTYSCRRVRGGFSGRLSEHAIGNAIDFGTFTPKRGTVVSVARHFRPFEDPPDEKSRFLRAVFDAFRSYDGFAYVIGPENRADHHDHIHVDRAEPWWRIGRIGG